MAGKKRRPNTHSPTIHRDASSAWAHLVRCGGLELTGRDAGFEAKLLAELVAPPDSSLDEVLTRTRLDEFLSAFFSVAQPYVRMFEAILRFFESAGATRGRQDWCIAFEGLEQLGLEHFKALLATWQSIRGKVAIPALNFEGAWTIRKILIGRRPERTLDLSVYSQQPRWPEWLVRWISRYDAGEFLPLPRDRLESDLPKELHVIFPFLCAFAFRLSKSGLSRNQLKAAWAASSRRAPAHDALNLFTLAWIESDFYLRNRLKEIYAAKDLTPTELQRIGKELQDFIDQHPTRYLEADVSMSQFEEVLRLPVWQQRHELYAVWVATEIVDSLQQHTVKLHHDGGRLEFAFRETLLATILTATPLTSIYAERRSPLSPDAKSTTRKEGIQPDYGVWRNGPKDARNCILAIECKHYLESAGSRFREVLSDYALSLPNAHVCLVNHGPIGDVLQSLPDHLLSRCSTFEHLMTENIEARQKLATLVRDIIGPPLLVVNPIAQASAQGDCVVVLDISPSMRPFLDTPTSAPQLLKLIQDTGATALMTIDEQIRDVLEPTQSAVENAVTRRGSGTLLAPALASLIALYKRAVVVTDEDGVNTLQGLGYTLIASLAAGVEVLDIHR